MLSLLLLCARQRTQWTHRDVTAVATAPAPLAGTLAAELGFALAVLVIVSPAILVFLWMLSLSLKNELDNIAYPPVFIPSPPTLGQLRRRSSQQNPFLLYSWNSIIVSGVATLVALLVGVPAGYGIARAQAAGIGVLILIARMTPGLAYLIPLFILFQCLGLDRHARPLVITHLVITVPIVVWIMTGLLRDAAGASSRRPR